MASAFKLYIGTDDGLYVGTDQGDAFSAAPAGFRDLGSMRARVVVDVDDPRRLYAGTTRAGVFRSDDAGQTWTELNHGLTYKNVWSIAQHPRTRTLFIGTSPAGVFRSDDRGDTWEQCRQLDTLPTTKGWTGPIPPHVSRMKALALHPDQADLVYGAIEEGWAVRSRDGGKTWDQIADGFDHDGHDIAIMPDSPTTIIAAGGKGMYRSFDQGDTWELSNAGIEDCHYTPADLVIHASRPNVMVTAVSAVGPAAWRREEGPGVAFVRSEDRGASWTVLTEGLPKGYHGVPRALAGLEGNLDVYAAGMTDGTVWLSRDGADSFHQVLGGLPPVLSVTIAPA